MFMNADSLLGMEQVKVHLCRGLALRNLHHAILFSGPRGVGKRSLARLLAMALLCRKGEGFGTCGRCGACHRVLIGEHPDLHYLSRPSGKTQIPVEQIRSLIDELQRASFEGRGRVAVLADVEALNREGQNSLLKTLEEPAPDTWIIMTTKKPEALLPTVLSRVDRIAVPTMRFDQLSDVLEREDGLSKEDACDVAIFAAGSRGKAKSIQTAGLAYWRNAMETLFAAHRTSPVVFARNILEPVDTKEEGARQAKRFRADELLGIATAVARDRGRRGEQAAWEDIAVLLDAEQDLQTGLSASLVLQMLYRRFSRLVFSGCGRKAQRSQSSS